MGQLCLVHSWLIYYLLRICYLYLRIVSCIVFSVGTLTITYSYILWTILLSMVFLYCLIFVTWMLQIIGKWSETPYISSIFTVVVLIYSVLNMKSIYFFDFILVPSLISDRFMSSRSWYKYYASFALSFMFAYVWLKSPPIRIRQELYLFCIITMSSYKNLFTLYLVALALAIMLQLKQQHDIRVGQMKGGALSAKIDTQSIYSLITL